MEVVSKSLNGFDLVAFNQARKRQEATFLSDICTANGSSIDPLYLRDWTDTYKFYLGRHRLTLDIGLECPTKDDWKVWESALRCYCMGRLTLPLELGKVKEASPRIWRVFHIADDDEIEVVNDRRGHINIYAWEGGGNYRWVRFADYDKPKGVPATVKMINEDLIKLFHTARLKPPEPGAASKPTFQEFLLSWGGEWMWEGLHLNQDPEWIVKCLRINRLVCVTDGSHCKSSAPDVCSAGWVMACRETGEFVAGTLVERSPWASSYRGELLGMLAIRLLLLAIEEYFDAVTEGNTSFCDNMGVIHTFEKESKRVPQGKSS